VLKPAAGGVPFLSIDVATSKGPLRVQIGK
jgi:hypothetical protein